MSQQFATKLAGAGVLVLRIMFQRGDTPPWARLALGVAISGWGD